MKSDFHIDEQDLVEKFKKLSMLLPKSGDLIDPEKMKILQLLYLIESDLMKLKLKLELPLLDSSIQSHSVSESLKLPNNYKSSVIHNPFNPGNQFRPEDYHYLLLIYLFLQHQNIRSFRWNLYEVIDGFISRIKSEYFVFADIELTASGATRCKTNIRFAFNELKELGLVYLYDKKNNWTLTFIGYILASSFCYDPVKPQEDQKMLSLNRRNSIDRESRVRPIEYNILYHSQDRMVYFFKLKQILEERSKAISDPNYFRKIIEYLHLDTKKLELLNNGAEIFEQYHAAVRDFIKQEKPDKESVNRFLQLIKAMDTKYDLSAFMIDFSPKISNQLSNIPGAHLFL